MISGDGCFELASYPAFDPGSGHADPAGRSGADADPLASGLGQPAVRNLFRPPIAEYPRAFCRLARGSNACRMAVPDRKAGYRTYGFIPTPYLTSASADRSFLST